MQNAVVTDTQANAQAFIKRWQGSATSNDALLTHLVALNAQRAAEEKAGHIRWLRPAFKNPVANKALQN